MYKQKQLSLNPTDKKFCAFWRLTQFDYKLKIRSDDLPKQDRIINAMHSSNDEHYKQNDLNELEDLLQRYHFEAAFLVIFVDAAEKRVQIHNVIPLGCKTDNKESSKNK